MFARDLFDDLMSGGWPMVERWVSSQQAESLNLDFKRRRPGALPRSLEDYMRTDTDAVPIVVELPR